MQTSWYEQQLARLRLKAKDEAKDKKKRLFSPLIPAVRVGARLRAARAAAAGLSTEPSPKSAGKPPRRRLVDKLTPKSPGAAMRRLRASLGKLGDKSPKTPSTPSLTTDFFGEPGFSHATGGHNGHEASPLVVEVQNLGHIVATPKQSRLGGSQV